MLPKTDQFCERLLIKCRLVNSVKLQLFAHNKNLYKRVRKQLGWSKVIANVALNAYSEFIELKLIMKDYDTPYIVPSWCIREVWKTHALCDAKGYEEGCKGLCGNIIRYQIEVKPDPEEGMDTNELFTEKVYRIRFNRGVPEPIWSFHFNPLWKNEYQSESDMKYSKKVKVSTPHLTADDGNHRRSLLETLRETLTRQSTIPPPTQPPSPPPPPMALELPTTSHLLPRRASNTNTFYSAATATVSSGGVGESSSSVNTDNVTGDSSNSTVEVLPNNSSSSVVRRAKAEKRPLPLRNPVMTRSRTKILKMDV